MKLPITGRCLCGAVRYTLKSLPIASGFCHCRSCQRATGSAYFPFLHVLASDLEIEGKITEFTLTGASGKQIHRGFCGQCGSTIVGTLEAIPGYKNISASSLDNPAEFVPQSDIWINDVQPWDCLNPSLRKFAENPVF